MVAPRIAPMKFTDTTAGMKWECIACPAWGLAPDRNSANKHAAKHVCHAWVAD